MFPLLEPLFLNRADNSTFAIYTTGGTISTITANTLWLNISLTSINETGNNRDSELAHAGVIFVITTKYYSAVDSIFRLCLNALDKYRRWYLQTWPLETRTWELRSYP